MNTRANLKGPVAHAKKVRAVLRRAAEEMMTSKGGACRAIAVAIDGDGILFAAAGGHFSNLFKPRHNKPRHNPMYWFGDPQHELTGEKERRTREHRIYALLLAAEAVE